MRSQMHTALLVGAALVSAAGVTAAPGRAGDVVVPLAVNQTLQGLTYTTRVWVANPTGAAQSFTAAFYAAGADGTATPPASNPQNLDAGTLHVYAPSVDSGSTGMISIRGAAGLEVNAVLETRSGQRLLGAVAVPSITADDAFAANPVG